MTRQNKKSARGKKSWQQEFEAILFPDFPDRYTVEKLETGAVVRMFDPGGSWNATNTWMSCNQKTLRQIEFRHRAFLEWLIDLEKSNLSKTEKNDSPRQAITRIIDSIESSLQKKPSAT